MFAYQLEAILADEIRKTDLSSRSPADMVERFQRLRGFGLLPTEPVDSAQHLTLKQISAAILSVATTKSGFAGHASKLLMDLRPVGGRTTSFWQSNTFGKAIETMLENPDALKSVVEIRVSCSEIYTNGHGRASIEHLSGHTTATSHYVGKLAKSVLQTGAEKTFNPRQLISSIVTDTVFYRPFLERLAREIERQREEPDYTIRIRPPQESCKTQAEQRNERLGITPSSEFLNMSVDNQVIWPQKETAIDFDGYKLILFPRTRDNSNSVHIDLTGQNLSIEDATTLINRFLSMMTWCDDQFSVLQDGWAGNPVPVATPKRELAFTTTNHWVFDRKIPDSDEARKAIAIYREARNAEQNSQVPYAVLCYYKLIELKHKGRADTRKWFRSKLELLRTDQHYSEDMESLKAVCGTQTPHDYLYTACRTAVAHANKPYSIDADDARVLRRLHIAANVLRPLARLFIKDELGLSDCMFDGT